MLLRIPEAQRGRRRLTTLLRWRRRRHQLLGSPWLFRRRLHRPQRQLLCRSHLQRALLRRPLLRSLVLRSLVRSLVLSLGLRPRRRRLPQRNRAIPMCRRLLHPSLRVQMPTRQRLQSKRRLRSKPRPASLRRRDLLRRSRPPPSRWILWPTRNATSMDEG